MKSEIKKCELTRLHWDLMRYWDSVRDKLIAENKIVVLWFIADFDENCNEKDKYWLHFQSEPFKSKNEMIDAWGRLERMTKRQMTPYEIILERDLLEAFRLSKYARRDQL